MSIQTQDGVEKHATSVWLERPHSLPELVLVSMSDLRQRSDYGKSGAHTLTYAELARTNCDSGFQVFPLTQITQPSGAARSIEPGLSVSSCCFHDSLFWTPSLRGHFCDEKRVAAKLRNVRSF